MLTSHIASRAEEFYNEADNKNTNGGIVMSQLALFGGEKAVKTVNADMFK